MFPVRIAYSLHALQTDTSIIYHSPKKKWHIFDFACESTISSWNIGSNEHATTSRYYPMPKNSIPTCAYHAKIVVVAFFRATLLLSWILVYGWTQLEMNVRKSHHRNMFLQILAQNRASARGRFQNQYICSTQSCPDLNNSKTIPLKRTILSTSKTTENWSFKMCFEDILIDAVIFGRFIGVHTPKKLTD